MALKPRAPWWLLCCLGRFDGTLQSQQGQLSIGGEISKIDVLAYTLDIQGKDFQVVDLPRYSKKKNFGQVEAAKNDFGRELN